mgnify:CR=1 FL=1
MKFVSFAGSLDLTFSVRRKIKWEHETIAFRTSTKAIYREILFSILLQEIFSVSRRYQYDLRTANVSKSNPKYWIWASTSPWWCFFWIETKGLDTANTRRGKIFLRRTLLQDEWEQTSYLDSSFQSFFRFLRSGWFRFDSNALLSTPLNMTIGSLWSEGSITIRASLIIIRFITTS